MSKTADYLMSLEKACCNCEHYRKDDVATRVAGEIRMVCDRDGNVSAPDDGCGYFRKCAEKTSNRFVLLAVLLFSGAAFSSEFEEYLVKFGRENGIEIVNKADPEIVYCKDGADMMAKTETQETNFLISVHENGARIYLLQEDKRMYYLSIWMYRFMPQNWQDDKEKWRALMKRFRDEWESRESPTEGGEKE